jgi:hypothetical protein
MKKKNEMEWVWMEALVSLIELLYWNLPRGTEETHGYAQSG